MSDTSIPPPDLPPPPDISLSDLPQWSDDDTLPPGGNDDYVEHTHTANWDDNPEHGANTEEEKLAVFTDEVEGP